jgi:pilus assembly protein Flp/PilA
MLSQVKRMVWEFYQCEEGPTAVEYAVMLALIITVCIGSVQILGANTNSTFKTVATKLGSASS